MPVLETKVYVPQNESLCCVSSLLGFMDLTIERQLDDLLFSLLLADPKCSTHHMVVNDIKEIRFIRGPALGQNGRIARPIPPKRPSWGT